MDVRLSRGGGADGIDDDDLAGRLRQPMIMGMRRRCVRVGAPYDDAPRLLGRSRIKAVERGTVHVSQGDVAGHVADRVRSHLRGAQAMKEAHRRDAREQRDGSRVMGIEDRPRSVRIHDRPKAAGDVGDRRIPAHGLEGIIIPIRCGPFAATLRAHALQGLRQALSRVTPLAVIGRRAFAAQRAAADRMMGVAAHGGDQAIALDDGDSAGIVAIPRAGRGEYFVARRKLRHGGPDDSALLNRSLRMPAASRRKGRDRSAPISAAVKG